MLLVKRYTVYIFQRLNSALRSLTIKMTHIEHQESHSMTSQSRLLYGLHDPPPFKDALLIELQHVCAILTPVLAVVATSIAKVLKLFTFYSISIHSFRNCFVGWAVYGSA